MIGLRVTFAMSMLCLASAESSSFANALATLRGRGRAQMQTRAGLAAESRAAENEISRQGDEAKDPGESFDPETRKKVGDIIKYLADKTDLKKKDISLVQVHHSSIRKLGAKTEKEMTWEKEAVGLLSQAADTARKRGDILASHKLDGLQQTVQACGDGTYGCDFTKEIPKMDVKSKKKVHHILTGIVHELEG
eukprot:TRINITY_DN14455_c0_g1_i1.p1 TRINITY_DN14455_c0_g1~~TRINITY_DN14455_c0_g1_i1.p1  ORF type:complete len:193 (-),score=45.44 TRINITY_DN14455_c0_g1_i1:137-715(-)